jgi:hypothetical protein
VLGQPLDGQDVALDGDLRSNAAAFTNVAVTSRKSLNFWRRILAVGKGQETGDAVRTVLQISGITGKTP